MTRTSSLLPFGSLIAALLVSGEVLAEQSPPQSMVASPTAASQTAMPVSGYTIGDKLRISFLEQLELPQQGNNSAALKTFYQRADLTSEYTVGIDGMISLPALGQIAVVGRDEASVRDDIVSAYESAMGRPGDVHVTIVDRQPVYVIGPVRSPGAFAYVPGMVAIQAVALAGGAERLQDRIGPVVEAGRETERSVQARARLATLLARRAWLQAMQDGRDPMPPDDLILLVGEKSAQELVYAEERAGMAAAATRRNEMARLDKTLSAALAEIDALERSVQKVEETIGAREAMIQEASELDPRLSDKQMVAALQSEIADLELRRGQFESIIQQTLKTVATERAARDKVGLDFGSKIAQELVTITDEIVRLRQTVSSASQIAGSIEGQSAPGDTDILTIEIVRTTADGPTTFPATPTTALRPGDVVRLSLPTHRSQKAAGLEP